ncbi:MAG: AAA family ATPase [Treponema sp.]
MVKEDLIERSAVRNFEKALDGVLQPGEVGIVTAKKGVGKTSMLVQLGLDQLLQGKPIVHISFSQHTDYAITWYNNMFDEVAEKKHLEKAADLKADVIARRIVLNFNQDVVRTVQIIKTVKALFEGGSKPSVLMIDDFDFSKAVPEAVQQMKAFAKEMGLFIWYTAAADVREKTVHPDLKPYENDLDVILYLEPATDAIKIHALKARGKSNFDTGCKLDPKTMMLAEK